MQKRSTAILRTSGASRGDALNADSNLELGPKHSLIRAIIFGPVEEVFGWAEEVVKTGARKEAETTQEAVPAANEVPHSDQPVGGLAKRLTDIVIAGLTLIILAPLMIVVATLIKFKLGGNVIYSHPRVGANGKSFKCFKFRTMVTNSQEVLLDHLASNPEAAKEWADTFKLMDDPRVTPLGRLLRRSSIDELPQLFNVLLGDMSCVGPRPVVAAELAPYGELASDYLRARPGLTGIWQISGRSAISYATRTKLDALYVRKWSWMLDMAILFSTPSAVLRINETA